MHCIWLFLLCTIFNKTWNSTIFKLFFFLIWSTWNYVHPFLLALEYKLLLFFYCFFVKEMQSEKYEKNIKKKVIQTWINIVCDIVVTILIGWCCCLPCYHCYYQHNQWTYYCNIFYHILMVIIILVSCHNNICWIKWFVFDMFEINV